MAVSYKRLWKVLIDKDMKKKDLETVAGVSHYTLNKMTKGENVMTEIIERICLSLDVTPDQIMEILPDEPRDGENKK